MQHFRFRIRSFGQGLKKARTSISIRNLRLHEWEPNRAPTREPTPARNSGFTLLEIIIVIAILSVLTAAAVPMVRNSVKREREAELRIALRELRRAIDSYKKYNEDTNGAAIPIEWKTQSGYPKELKLLVDGFIPANVVGTSGAKKRFLRRLPIDPMTGNTEWGLRAYKDAPDSTSWSGEDVFDVYSKSDGVPLNGVGKYKDW